MSLTGSYIWDRDQSAWVKVSDRARNHKAGALADVDALPFKQKVMEGYRRQEAAGTLSTAYRASTIKSTWSNA